MPDDTIAQGRFILWYQRSSRNSNRVTLANAVKYTCSRKNCDFRLITRISMLIAVY